MGALGKFALDKVKGLVSKKVAATAIGVAVVGEQEPVLAGASVVVYVIVQGLLDGWKMYLDRVHPEE